MRRMNLWMPFTLVASLTFVSAAYAQKVKITSFDVSGALATYARAINSEGQITGYYDAGGGFHGFLRDQNGVFTSFDVPGSIGSTFALDINSKGQIMGMYSDSIRDHVFIRERTARLPLSMRLARS